MSAVTVLAVQADIHPKAIVRSDGALYVVSHPECRIQIERALPESRLQAAVAKHDYEALDKPLELSDELELKEYMDKQVDGA